MNPNRQLGVGGLELLPPYRGNMCVRLGGEKGERGSAEGVLTAAIRSGERHIVI
jgi:hypothetical protein